MKPDNWIRVRHLEKDAAASMSKLKANRSKVRASRAIVDKALNDGNTYYSINTGFGVLVNKRINNNELKKLQKNLLISHAVGVGDLIPKDITRLMMMLKIHSLGLGYSGVSEKVFERLLVFLENDRIPAVPRKGSVGASGDLAPLAHMSLPIIGQGFFWDSNGDKTIPASEAIKEDGLEIIELEPKDGLALLNGTQMMAAYAAYVLSRCENLLKAADIISIISLEALRGSIKPFDARIHEVRPHKGQIDVADNVRKLLVESEILESHRNCSRVQDPYSLRCIPQVHGATRDSLNHCISVVETEINSVTDNPLTFENGDIISGGNFHGQPLALVLDFAAIALAALANISERRTYLLLEGNDGLPELLMTETGVNSGFMIPQYTAAALVAENKVLSHPASVDSIPTSGGQEDHVSMGSISAHKLLEVFRNVEMVIAIELITAAQALDFREPLKPGDGVVASHKLIRQYIPHLYEDSYFTNLISSALELIQSGKLVAAVEAECGDLK
jgi:histidine ammonia-lyase